jgi:hypothetical protein
MGRHRSGEVTDEAARILLTHLERERDAYHFLDLSNGVLSLSVRMEPQEAAQAIFKLMMKLSDQTSFYSPNSPDTFHAINRVPKMLADGLKVVASRMDKPGLANSLKNPLCVGIAQKVLLQEFGKRAGLEFASLWDFVDWAQQHEPTLDLLSPWQRPGN